MMHKHNSPRIAVVGCGHWGKNLIRNFYELGALYALCDREDAKTQDLASRYGCKTLSEGEILRDPLIDALVIATGAHSHEPLSQVALQAGKHVYVEKPMALSTKTARALTSLAKTHNRILMVGHILNYHPAFIALKEHLPELGPLKHIYANRLGLGRFRDPEGILWDLSCHDVSLILALAQGMPTHVHAVGQAYLTPDKPAAALLTLSFDSGLTAHVHASWLSPFKEQKLVVIGERGIAVFDDRKPWAEKLHLSLNCLVWEEGKPHANLSFQHQAVPLPESEPLKAECLHFLNCIATGTEPLTSASEGLRVIEVLEEAENAMHNLSVSPE